MVKKETDVVKTKNVVFIPSHGRMKKNVNEKL